VAEFSVHQTDTDLLPVIKFHSEKNKVYGVPAFNLDLLVGKFSAKDSKVHKGTYCGSRRMEFTSMVTSASASTTWFLEFAGDEKEAETSRHRFIEMLVFFKNKLKMSHKKAREFRDTFTLSIHERLREIKKAEEEAKEALLPRTDKDGFFMRRTKCVSDLITLSDAELGETRRRRLSAPIEHLLCEIAQLQ